MITLNWGALSQKSSKQDKKLRILQQKLSTW
jgi:hypothetical protein